MPNLEERASSTRLALFYFSIVENL